MPFHWKKIIRANLGGRPPPPPLPWNPPLIDTDIAVVRFVVAAHAKKISRHHEGRKSQRVASDRPLLTECNETNWRRSVFFRWKIGPKLSSRTAKSHIWCQFSGLTKWSLDSVVAEHVTRSIPHCRRKAKFRTFKITPPLTQKTWLHSRWVVYHHHHVFINSWQNATAQEIALQSATCIQVALIHYCLLLYDFHTT